MAKNTAVTRRTRGDLLEVNDVCSLYHVDRKTVYRWIKAGKLSGRKAGQKWLFSWDSVAGVLE